MLRMLNYCGRDAADAGDDSAAAGAAIVVVARSLYTYRLIIQCSICSYLCHYCHFLRNWFLPKQFPDKKVTKTRGRPPQPGEPQGHPGLRNLAAHGDRRVPVEAGRQLPCAAEVQKLLRQLLQEGARYFFIR